MPLPYSPESPYGIPPPVHLPPHSTHTATVRMEKGLIEEGRNLIAIGHSLGGCLLSVFAPRLGLCADNENLPCAKQNASDSRIPGTFQVPSPSRSHHLEAEHMGYAFDAHTFTRSARQ